MKTCRVLGFSTTLILVGAVALGSWSSAKASRASAPCPKGQTYVSRVIGGYERTPASNPYGQCVAEEILKGNLVEKPTAWTTVAHTLLASLRMEEATAAGTTVYHVRQDGAGDCTTISQCQDRLQPGDTLIVHAGTYVEEPTFPGGTSWSEPVTVMANPGDKVWVRLPGPDVHGGILGNDVSYIILDGINIHGGTWIGGGHVRMQNLEVANADSQGIIGCPRGYCELINLHVHHVAWTQDNQMTCPVNNWTNGFGYCHGIYFGHSDHNLVDGGEYHHISGFCTHPNPGDGWTIRNVRCHDAAGILSYGSNYLVYNNLSYNNYNPQNNQEANALTGYSYGGNNRYFNNTIAGTAFIQGNNNVLHNNIVTGSLEEQQPGASTLSHNLIGTNPQFVNAAAGNFHLQPGSPAIDAGMDLSVEGVTADLEWTPRPQGAGFDIGAYEYRTAMLLIGDLDGDGRRTLIDVRWLIEMLVGTRPKDLAKADLTKDGTLTLADCQALIKLLVGVP